MRSTILNGQPKQKIAEYKEKLNGIKIPDKTELSESELREITKCEKKLASYTNLLNKINREIESIGATHQNFSSSDEDKENIPQDFLFLKEQKKNLILLSTMMFLRTFTKQCSLAGVIIGWSSYRTKS